MSAYKLVQGEALALLRDMPTGSVDAIVTDPPYSSGGFTRGDRMGRTTNKYTGNDGLERPDFAGDSRDQRAFLVWCSLWLAECLRVAKPGAPIAVFSDWRQLATMIDAIQCGGFVFRGVMPWDKTEAVRPRMGGFRSQCEYVVWGSAGELPQRTDVGVLAGVIRARVRTDDKHHITGKPTEVMRHVVKICPPGGVVLDPFAGSGTTLVAALLEGRAAVGFELSTDYIRVAQQRCREVAP